MRFRIILLFILMQSLHLYGQFYNTGQAPASIQWMQIKTDNFQIIYPSGFYNKANRIANILDYMYNYTSADYNLKPKKVSIILINQSVTSNGFVAWAPKRSEWVTTPPSSNYPHDWLEQLALHEYRHVVQLDKLEQGATKLLKILFGEMATGAVAAYLPFWFLEGDAIVNETAFSSTGRGRQSDFDIELRAIERDKKKRYSYDQSYLGSYKYFIPNYYKYGYQMVAFGKLKYDNNIWNSTLSYVARKPFLLAPFYFGMRKNGAVSKTRLYNETFDSLKILWNNDLAKSKTTNTIIYYDPKLKYYTNYLYPQQLNNCVFAVRSGIDDITRFVVIKDTTEKILFTPAGYSSTPVCAGNKYIVWEETQPDLRWQQRNYSVIKIFDLKKGRSKQISQRSRYFSPNLSSGEDSLVVLHIDYNNNYSLVLLQTSTGKKIAEIPVVAEIEISNPVWVNRDEIAFVASGKKGKKIELANLRSGLVSVLFDAGYTNISNISKGNDILFFSFDQEHARNIYALNLTSKEVNKITFSRYGADYPNFDLSDSLLFYSDYTVNGFRIAQKKIVGIDRPSLKTIVKYKHPWAESLSENSSINLQLTDYQGLQFDSSKYSRILHILNIHSWAPFYFNPKDFTNITSQIYPGFTILSQNKLSTVTSSLSYFYKDNTHHLEPKISWYGLFPVFEFSAMFTSEPLIDSVSIHTDFPEHLKNYSSFTIWSYLPLNFTRNKYYRYIQPGIQYTLFNRYFYSHDYRLRYDYMEYSLYAYNLLKTAHRDIETRFGQTIYFAFIHPLSNSALFSNATVISLNFYFPGIFKHHFIRLNMSYEKQELKSYLLKNRISLPRGYYSDKNYIRINRGSMDYTLPIFYPDWSFGPVVYLKRIYTTIFCDYANIGYPIRSGNTIIVLDESACSIGTKISTEINFLRFIIPVVPGIVISYLPLDQKMSIGFSFEITSSLF